MIEWKLKRRNERSNGYWRGEEEGKKERERDDDMRERVSVLRVLQGHLIKIYFFFIFSFSFSFEHKESENITELEGGKYTVYD